MGGGKLTLRLRLRDDRDDALRRWRTTGKEVEDYYCYGAPVLAGQEQKRRFYELLHIKVELIKTRS